MFFTYNQNNSGGSFTYDKVWGISEYVIIEADSADEANDIAEGIGLYFDGCADGMDCECCGDRWYRAWDDEDGEDEPSVYGKPIGETVDTFNLRFSGLSESKKRKIRRSDDYIFPVVVHYKDGSIKWSGD